MRVPSVKKDTGSAWFDIAVFAAVVAFFLFSARSLTKTRPPVGAPVHETGEISAVRVPASIEHSPPRERSPESIKTIDVGCLNAARPFHADASISMLRLVGGWCTPDRPTGANGLHEGTGTEILTFARGDASSFTTSYFPLLEGQNRISFELHYRGGKTRRESLEVIRSSENK